MLRRVLVGVLALAVMGLFVSCGGDSGGTGSGETKEAGDDQVHELMMAAYEGKADVVKGLLEQGVDVNSTDDRGGTALMQAAAWGRAEVVEVLLDGGADLDARSDGGNTALIAAAGKGHCDIAETLLGAGADPRIENNAGQTAAVKAAFGAGGDCVVMLKKAEEAAASRVRDSRR